MNRAVYFMAASYIIFIIAELNILNIRERTLKSTTFDTNSPIIKKAVPRGEHFTNSSTLQSLCLLYILPMIYGLYNVAVLITKALQHLKSQDRFLRTNIFQINLFLFI
jgi:hypothetical protein